MEDWSNDAENSALPGIHCARLRSSAVSYRTQHSDLGCKIF